MNKRERVLRTRICWLTWFFIVALVISGATAIPLQTELSFASRFFSKDSPSALASWIFKVQEGLLQTNEQYPFMAYGTDWLAFGHFVIAVAFIGPLRDPVRNIWVYAFGMIACILILPYAFLIGEIRGIPFYWRLIDCSFGVFGFIPLWLCYRMASELEKLPTGTASQESQFSDNRCGS